MAENEVIEWIPSITDDYAVGKVTFTAVLKTSLLKKHLMEQKRVTPPEIPFISQQKAAGCF